ncbi:hypothetical protein ACNPQM_23260 [Streptomyces sp. NPDC056231]|uniref:hypothetical protein n=1 Tax=Streptomyces sp. NPDC056231 TaxID=3345755 RepID=UPI003AAB2BFF
MGPRTLLVLGRARITQRAQVHPLRSTARWKVSPGSYSLALQVNGCRFHSVAFAVLNTWHRPARPDLNNRHKAAGIRRRGPVRAVRNPLKG